MIRKPTARRAPDDALKSLAKVVAVLEAFTAARRAMSLAKIATATGFPRSGVRIPHREADA